MMYYHTHTHSDLNRLKKRKRKTVPEWCCDWQGGDGEGGRRRIGEHGVLQKEDKMKRSKGEAEALKHTAAAGVASPPSRRDPAALTRGGLYGVQELSHKTRFHWHGQDLLLNPLV